MFRTSRLAVLLCVATLLVAGVVWQNARSQTAANVSPSADIAASNLPAAPVAADASAERVAASRALPLVTTAAEPAPLRFGDQGAVTLQDIPDSRLRRELAALTPDARRRTLDQLATLRVPRHDVASLRVDRTGRLIYHCPPPSAAQMETALEVAGKESVTKKDALAVKAPAAAAVPITSPPVRHSRLGATKVIYLDFNGHTITGTAWNDEEGAEATYLARPYDSDGNPTTFSDEEQNMIVEIWARLAEDFTPFDVDVTTQEPTFTTQEPTFTTQTGRILFTKVTDANGKVMPDSATAGGVAFLDVFGDSDYAYYSPALVYSDKYYGDAGNMADAGSHEMGHNLALSHDGTAADEYYEGHYQYGTPSWGPLMGSPYYRTVTQWSKGEYLNSNNNQDDLAVLAATLGYRPDDHADSNDSATALSGSGSLSLSGSGAIGTTGDNDRFWFTSSTGLVQFEAVSRPVPSSYYGPNLDVALELYDSAGNLLVVGDDGGSVSQSLNYAVTAGTYYLRVKGVGCGNPYDAPPSGYTPYASLGSYTVTGTLSAGVSPQINQHPGASTTIAGQSAGFYAYAYGTPNPTYQWQRLPVGGGAWVDLADTAAYSGTTTYNLMVSSPTVGMNGDQFRMVATNITGSATSNAATLTVNPATPPSIYSGPYSTSTTVGTTISFSANVSGTYPFTYRWQRLPAGGETWTDVPNSGPYSGATSGTLTINSPTLAMNGDKFLYMVSNEAGSVTSAAATLTVTPVIAPTITNLPTVSAVAYGDSFYLYPSISGTWPISYQWYFNNQPIANATSQSFSRSGNTATNSGTYTLKATNAAGSASASVEVTVGSLLGLVVTQAPVSVEAVKSTSASFSITVTGSQPITYQWRRNGAPLPSGTQAYYSISSVTKADAGDYTVVVTNDAGSITSSAAQLTVLPQELPKFTGWSSSFTISPNSGLSLYASVDGVGTMYYQWFKDGVVIPGATGSSYYAYSNLGPANAGTYTLQVTNDAGTIVSPDAVVTWLNGTGSLPWLSARRQGDIVYFLQVTPGRIQRYDLNAEAWLPVVYLAETKVPTAFLPTAEGVFIAYNKELVRRSLELQAETPVGTGSAAINALFTAGDLIYLREGDYYTTNLLSFNRATLASGPTSSPGSYAFAGLAGGSPAVYSALAGKVFTTRPGLSPNDVERFTVGSDGVITANGDSPYHGDFRIGSALALFPDESKLITNAGVIYSNPDLTYQGSVGQAYDDIAFLSDGSIVALRGRTLMAHAGEGWAETGRFALATEGAALFRRDDNLYVFGAPAGSGNGSNPVVRKVPTGSFMLPASPVPGSPHNRRVSLDGIFLDANKVINIISRGEQGIVRWDTASRQFLPTLPLRGRPYLSSYALVFDRLVLTYSDGTLTDLFPASDPTEQAFGSLPVQNAAFGLVAMDDMVGLNIRQADSSANLRLVLGPQGGTKYLSTWNYWTPFDHWISASRRVFSLSTDYYSSGGGSYEEVSATGALPVSPGGSNTNLAGPLRSTPEGTLLLSLNGRVFNADLQQTAQLDNKVADGTWLPNALCTIRVRPEGTQVQKWARITYALVGQMDLPGIPQRIFRLDESNLVVVTTVDGYLVFNLISSALEPVATITNDPNAAPERPALFDAEAYLINNSDVAADIPSNADRAQKAWEHYWKYGLAEGRTEGDFNVGAYMAQYPGAGTDPRAAALYWYTTGRKNGDRIPAGFDVEGYFARNLDIKAYFANDKYGAWLHYYNYGLFEGRSFDTNFIAGEYLELNLDLKEAGGGDLQGAVLHWLSYGHPIEDRMGRVPIGFNVENYLARYPDLAAAFANITPVAVRNVAVWHHYIAYGTLEGRSDGDFEAYDYLATNADLAAIFDGDVQTAALHWFFYGRREGRRIPFGFDVINYRALYPDLVVFSGDDLYGCWLHYRDTGINEGRIYDDKFRPADYLALNPDIAVAVGNNHRDAFLHWIYYGQFEGRQGRL